MKKRTVSRDLVVYFLSSARWLLLKGEVRLFFRDLSFFKQWRQYRVSLKGTLDHRVPWLVFGCIRFLDTWLRKDMQVFEYGSGGSTLYFAERTKRVISIEHDRAWYEQVKKNIASVSTGHPDYRLIEPQVLQDNRQRNCTNPRHYVSCFTAYKGFEFSDYASAIDAFADSSFDLVVVDGRVRPSCIAHALQKVKSGGALLLDNADRSYYLAPFPELFDEAQWQLQRFTGHFPFGPASVLNTSIIFIKR